MRALAFFCFLSIGVAALCVRAGADTMTPSMVGVGAHGYDWLVGSWSCHNSMPSAMGGPADTKLTATHSVNGSLSLHSSGASYDGLGYVAYEEKTKTWYNPFGLADGSSSSEWSKQTGTKTVWTGTFLAPGASKPTPIRDTYTMSGMTKYFDVTEAQGMGGWKTVGKTTCTKSM